MNKYISAVTDVFSFNMEEKYSKCLVHFRNKHVRSTQKNLDYSANSNSQVKIVLNVDGDIKISDTIALCNHVKSFFTTVTNVVTDKLPEVSSDFGSGLILLSGYTQVKVFQVVILN